MEVEYCCTTCATFYFDDSVYRSSMASKVYNQDWVFGKSTVEFKFVKIRNDLKECFLI